MSSLRNIIDYQNIKFHNKSHVKKNHVLDLDQYKVVTSF